VNEKTTDPVVFDISTTTIVINNHMAFIQVQMGRIMVDDVILDGGNGVNIITEQLRDRLRLPKPKPTPYNLQMANQTTTKPMGLIKDLKMYVHSISYIATFIILHKIVVDSNYSMLFGKP
jgi:hypothetical protein